MKIVLMCNSGGALYVFRNPLIRALLKAGHEVVGVCPDSEYTGRLLGMGVRIHLVEFSRHSVSPLHIVGLLYRLWRIVCDEKPDVVHGFTHKAVIYGALAARLASVPRIVMTVTGLGTLFSRDDARARLLRSALLAQYRIALSRHVNVLFQNPDDMHELVSLGAVRQKNARLTNGSGIDLSQFQLPGADIKAQMRAMLAHEIGTDLTNRMVVLFPARGVPEKGFLEFYDAARLVGDAAPGRYCFVHLGLIDSGTSRHFSAGDVATFARDQGVHYLGFKDNISDYMIASDIVALPSYYREGVPRSLIEALALGKTLITTDAPGCRETVIDGINGFLCTPRSARSLARAVMRVDSAMIEKARLRSRRYCEEKFDVKQLNSLTFSLYGLEGGQ
ncbi:glycosyl transferase family 1 [Novosphingobium sp. AAP83]|uniref:glycosyltransferase family 4 protein n=1 Tax=Novosphingobium sp. AAP83 TaxID=1523425 RepID=UPI0006B9902C|nr:glycosyltransferase family 4 protein [Novosphingobium sp. AAP83]KPF90227.1 glycosyl transferase family 1 [Novosphingobium sp. AAP83]